MEKFKKTVRQALPVLPCILLGALICMRYEEFTVFKNYGMHLFVISIISLITASLMSFLPKEHRFMKSESIVLFLCAPLLMEIAVEILNGNMLWDIDLVGNTLMNYLINLIIQCILWALFGSIRWSMRICCMILELFGVVNFFLKQFKGSPFLPWDITSIQTAAAVADSYTYHIGVEILFSLVMCLLVWKCSDLVKTGIRSRTYRYSRGICGACMAGLVGIYYGTDILNRTFGATPDFFNQTRGYEAKGAIAEFLVNTKYMSLSAPDGYDPDSLEQDVLNAIDHRAPGIFEQATGIQTDPVNVEKPDIIVIMNESYADLSVIGHFDTNQDYMPYVNSLIGSENVIQGNCYVSTIGTGTSNTEYEFLTGNSMAFLPFGSNAYQRYIDHDTYSLISTLKNDGYTAEVMHPYYKEDWNRPAVYEDFGFDSFIAYEDRPYWEKLRRYVSDEQNYEVLKEMHSDADPSKPYFMFNITMQNHSSYDQSDPDFIEDIQLQGLNGDFPLTQQYLSLIKVSDQALEDLITYYSNAKKPTIILMFGDHQPFIEDSFYEEVMGKPITQLSDEENQKRYITRFIMWANYDIPEGWIDLISADYLSVLLAQCSGMELSPYMQFLNTLYGKVPVVTALGCKDANGNYFKAEEDNPYRDLLSIYAGASYNLIQEDEKRISNLFTTK